MHACSSRCYNSARRLKNDQGQRHIPNYADLSPLIQISEVVVG
jgi:hypothetical protein